MPDTVTAVITLQEVARAGRWAVVLLVLALSGCGVWPLDRPTASPSPLPGDRLVFMVEGGVGGFTPYFHQALISPALAVYGDGRVIQYAESTQEPNVPAAYELSRADPELVATFVANTEARDLITSETDFGEPSVSDVPSTTVQLHGAGAPQRIYVYAFDAGFDDGLPPAQRRARQELTEVIDRASMLPGDSERLPYRPDRVRVTEFAFDGGGKGAGATWPGPDPQSFLVPTTPRSIRLACGELTGRAAEKVYDAARNNPDGIWTVDSKPRVFAVVPILPTMAGCP
jgi:hypothetical protein